MTQIFIIGSSSVYGVGASQGGWGDLIKKAVHQKMYTESGAGEKYEVFNFGKSGAKIAFALELFPKLMDAYKRKGKTISIVSIGGNNAKAEVEPNNYVSTLEEYEAQMSELLDMLKDQTDEVIAVGSGFVDESKTNPKHNPLTGGKSYFTNERRKIFEQRWKEMCEQKGISFIGVEMSIEEWQAHYVYADGLHPNQKGHEYIAQKVLPILEQCL